MNISRQIAGYLKSRELVLASLETGTAGAITAALADLPGVATSLDIGVVAHTPRSLAGYLGTTATNEAVSETLARTLAEALLKEREGRANVVLASIGWLEPEDGGRAAIAHCFAWAGWDRDAVVSSSETVLFSGRRVDIRRSIARRALLGLPRFVDSIPARERAD